MHILIRLEIHIVKRMSTFKNCCQFKALKNYNLGFFSTPLILSHLLKTQQERTFPYFSKE